MWCRVSGNLQVDLVDLGMFDVQSGGGGGHGHLYISVSFVCSVKSSPKKSCFNMLWQTNKKHTFMEAAIIFPPTTHIEHVKEGNYIITTCKLPLTRHHERSIGTMLHLGSWLVMFFSRLLCHKTEKRKLDLSACHKVGLETITSTNTSLFFRIISEGLSFCSLQILWKLNLEQQILTM